MARSAAAHAREIPPPLELLCLRTLWSLGEGNVKDVQQAIAGSKTLAYTTVMTLLDRLEKRGCATRRKPGRSFLYRPKINRDTMRDRALKQLLAGFFDGSADALLAYLRHPRSHAAKHATPEK